MKIKIETNEESRVVECPLCLEGLRAKVWGVHCPYPHLHVQEVKIRVPDELKTELIFNLDRCLSLDEIEKELLK